MPRLSTYSVEELRAKAQKSRDFAQRCEDEADRNFPFSIINYQLKTM